MKTPTKLYTYTKENRFDDMWIYVPISPGSSTKSMERNPEYVNSFYIENGKHLETDLIECFELDIEARDTIKSLGIFKVTPDLFTVEIGTSYDRTNSWYDYILTDKGWEYLEDNGLKHPGRGFVSYELITYEDVRIKKEKLYKEIEGAKEQLEKLNKL